MANISNVSVYGLDESIYRSGYAMLSQTPSEGQFNLSVQEIKKYRELKDYNYPHLKRAINLANAKGGGHNQFLTGIIVQFDMTFTIKAWCEAERYHFLDFVTSMSTIHRVSTFDMDKCCNEYVCEETMAIAERLMKEYKAISIDEVEKRNEAYLKLLYNIPTGLEITAGMTTNYRCLRNMYQQRKTHRLPDWHGFCDWVETLPMANELIIGGTRNE